MAKQARETKHDTNDCLCEDHAWVMRREAGSFILVANRHDQKRGEAIQCEVCTDEVMSAAGF